MPRRSAWTSTRTGEFQGVEPNATLSAVCVEDGHLTEHCRAEDLDRFLVEDQLRRRAAAARPPTPAG